MVNDVLLERRLGQMMMGNWVTQAIYVAAKLGIADLLHNGPMSADELAAATGCHARSLYRVLRALAGAEIFWEEDDGRFRLTPLAELLRDDVPGSKRAMAIMMGEEHYQAWGDLIYSVETGKGAFENTYQMPIFEYLSRNPEKGRIFDAAMTSIHGTETAAIIDAYDFSGIETLMDVGGGNASVLIEVLRRNPKLQGVLFDLPAVVERARNNVVRAGLENRCQLQSGSFFEAIPAGADAYFMRHIIHDWDDERAGVILQNCRAAVPEHGRVLVVESIVPLGNEPAPVKWLDLAMLVLPEGAERTEGEYRQLFQSNGLGLSRIVPTTAGVTVLEARRN